MPTYEYQCKACGHTLEEFHSIMDPPLTRCPKCDTDNLLRVMGTGVGLIFRGTGFYLTDYKKSGGSASSPSGGSSENKSSGGSSENKSSGGSSENKSSGGGSQSKSSGRSSERKSSGRSSESKPTGGGSSSGESGEAKGGS